MVVTLLVVSVMLSGGVFGFFYAWSFTVMRGLSAAEGASAIAAMQAVNRSIMTGWFALLFFGAPVATGVAAAAAWARGGTASGLWLAAATLAYLGGCFVVTVVVNVPMNEALARLDPAALADPDAAWRDYAGRWTAWNHVRTLGCAAALLCAALGLWSWR